MLMEYYLLKVEDQVAGFAGTLGLVQRRFPARMGQSIEKDNQQARILDCTDPFKTDF